MKMKPEDSKAENHPNADNSTGKAIDAARELGGFLDEVLGEGFRHLGLAFADWAASYRYQNLVDIREKLIIFRNSKGDGAKPIPIPPRFAVPLLNAASMEDDPTIQELWVKLIGNATDPENRFNLRKIFIETMRQLEPLDAKILFFLARKDVQEDYDMHTGRCLNASEIAGHLNVTNTEAFASMTNLFRLGCIIDSWEHTMEQLDRGYGGFRVENPNSNFRPSFLGRELINACSET